MARQSVWLAVALTLLAAALRVHRLDQVALRGDEAFSVLTWAQPPVVVWEDLAGWEPHPIGTFIAFWGWKTLVGDSEWAMRALPLLINLMGVAVMMVLAKRLLRQREAVWMLGLLWAVNPFQVWHAQDVRNYAIWAVLSPLAFWLFLRALDHNRPRDWALYGVAQILACYSFLLEPFFLVVQLLYVLIYYRERLLRVVITWAVIGIALLPLLIQLYRLSISGYSGTAARVSFELLVTEFFPTLLFGDSRLSVPVGLALMLAVGVGLLRGVKKTPLLLFGWLFLPLLFLMLAGTRMSVFLPRYILTITPPLLLAIILIAYRGGRRYRFVPLAVTGVLVIVSAVSLYAYFYTDTPKSPDWRSITTFLRNRTRPGDAVITTNVDPAFTYYYPGPAEEIPWLEVNPATLLTDYRGVFVQTGEVTFEVAQFLQVNAQPIPPAIAVMKQSRAYEVDPAEIEQPLDLVIGDVAQLHGYTLLGGDAWGLTVMLYWEPLRQTEGEMVAFVHVIGAGGYVTGADHIPLEANASTTAWEIGDLLRDPFWVMPPTGIYSLYIGMYDQSSVERLPIYDGEGNLIGDSYLLTEIMIRK